MFMGKRGRGGGIVGARVRDEVGVWGWVGRGVELRRVLGVERRVRGGEEDRSEIFELELIKGREGICFDEKRDVDRKYVYLSWSQVTRLGLAGGVHRKNHRKLMHLSRQTHCTHYQVAIVLR